jgi:predicted ATP-grasp superfamily ATP-dependent carboligase
MNNLLQLSELPTPDKMYMIGGWRQWADAGAVSSGLPAYLIEHLKARKIGEIKADDCYLFQVPGTHHFLRPEIDLKAGYRQSLESRRNEIFYVDVDGTGLVIFLGDEPHLAAERYTDAFLDAVEALGVRRVVVLGGVYGAMPYDKHREVSCVYSLPDMYDELSQYAVRFSDYQGGATIGTLIVDRAEGREAEVIDFYVFVPAYDFSHLADDAPGLSIENDYKAWFDIMRRVNHMFDLNIDLADLEQHGDAVIASMDERIRELDEQMPDLELRSYLEQLTDDFIEAPFIPLGDVWERELGDLFDD